MLTGRTSTLRLYLYNAISLYSAASSPRRSGKSPLPHRVARWAAAVAQVSLEDARNALFRCQGVLSAGVRLTSVSWLPSQLL